MENTTRGIYIDLDSIFDTRIGTIAEIDPELVPILLDSNYLQRQSDVFGIIEEQTYKDLYKLRDVNTLEVSPYTRIFNVINNIINRLLKTAIDSPFATGAKLYVNTYPYKLSDEFIGTLLEFVVTQTNKLVEVQICNLSEDQLTFSFCKDKFDFLIMYDYNTFLETNINKNEHTKASLNNRTLLAPELYYRNFKEEEILKLYKNNPLMSGKTLADIFKMVASPSIILELIEPQYFSVDADLYKSDLFKKQENNEKA